MAHQMKMICSSISSQWWLDNYRAMGTELGCSAEARRPMKRSSPWHVSCLAVRPETLASTLQWVCPDCTDVGAPAPATAFNGGSGELVSAIQAIEADASLTERQKAKRRQELLNGHMSDRKGKEKVLGRGNDVLDLLNFKCPFCIQLPERPVTKAF